MTTNLSKHFTVAEAEFSLTAIEHGIDNTLPSVYYQNAMNVAEAILEPVRKRFGAFSPSSWYRGEKLNELVRGRKTSQHCQAAAVDFEIKGVDNLFLAEWIRDNLAFDQLILEFYKEGQPNSGWVHCSFVKGNNRNQCLTTPDGKNYRGGLGYDY